jgi:uncharacterized membrane protein YeaQ/YmgE (transglycosylase-associated protein family)
MVIIYILIGAVAGFLIKLLTSGNKQFRGHLTWGNE